MVKLLATLACAALLGAPSLAQTAGVRISPVNVALGGAHRVASLRLQNVGAIPRAFQIDARAWSQRDGQDVLAPTDDLVVTPSVFEAGAGRTQIIRVAAQTPGAAGAERAYRLLLREIALADEAPMQGLRLRLEISLPVFVRDDLAAFGALQADRADGALRIRNVGARHVQLVELAEAGAPLAAPRYLLAGAAFAAPVRPGPVHVRYLRDTGAAVEETWPDAPALRNAP